jgi:ribosomal protein S3
MGLATDKVMEVITKHGDDPREMENELQRLFNIVPEEYQVIAYKANSQEQFAELLATKINEKLNPPVEEPRSLSSVMYPAMTESLAKAREPHTYDPSKSLGENLYPNSGDLFKGRV